MILKIFNASELKHFFKGSAIVISGCLYPDFPGEIATRTTLKLIVLFYS